LLLDDTTDPYEDLESCATCSKYEASGCDSSGETYGHCAVLNEDTYSIGLCADYVAKSESPAADVEETVEALWAQYWDFIYEEGMDPEEFVLARSKYLEKILKQTDDPTVIAECSKETEKLKSAFGLIRTLSLPEECEPQEGELLPKAPVTNLEKPSKATTREAATIDPDHDVTEKWAQYLKAEWDEKQKTEVALQNAVRHDFSNHWPDDIELLKGTVLEIKATPKGCAAATLVEQQGDKPFIVYCLRYQRDESGEIIKTLKDHRTYVRASSAHNKVYKWVNEEKQTSTANLL